MSDEHYGLLIEQAGALIGEERDPIANAANLSALVYTGVAELNWAGFYFLHGSELVLGPFQGQPACVRIAVGAGVCGTAAQTSRPVLVDDVHRFAGHIACDGASASELVVPLIGERLFGVFDLDSPRPARFGKPELDLAIALAELWVQRSAPLYPSDLK